MAKTTGRRRPLVHGRPHRRGARDPRRHRRRLRLVQGLPHPAAGGLRRRRALAPRRALRRPRGGALQVRLARRRGRPRHPLPDLPRAAAGLRRPAARPRRLPRLRHPLGGGPRAAGRLLQEDHGLPARDPDLRHLPRRELPHRPRRHAGDRAHRPLAHHQRHGLPRLPRGRRQRPALVRRRHDARDRAQLRPRARRQADVPLRHHPDRQQARAGAGRRTSPGSTPTTARPGAPAATARST